MEVRSGTSAIPASQSMKVTSLLSVKDKLVAGPVEVVLQFRQQSSVLVIGEAPEDIGILGEAVLEVPEWPISSEGLAQAGRSSPLTRYEDHRADGKSASPLHSEPQNL